VSPLAQRGTRQAVFLLGLSILATGAPAQADDALVEHGRRIYQEGILSDGQTLRAISAGNARLSNEQAACVVCHRRSGMGSREGAQAVSRITGPALYAKPVPYWPVRPGREVRIKPLRRDTRSAYDDNTLARALREGIDPDGSPLTPLMPRYELSETDTQALIAYLRQLSVAPVPGLEEGRKLHLATIVTADADPVRSKLVSDTLTAWARTGALGGVPLDLKVWKLEGSSDTWGQQLRDYNQRQPVYAVISGAGRAQWTPVRDFCEQAALPCLFPIVDLAPSDPKDFYTLYFSRGVPLEAHMLARHINELAPAPAPARVVQLVSDEAGTAAAQMLGADLDGLPHELRRWQTDAPRSLLTGLKPGDVLVAWLRPAELAQLAKALPAGPGTDRVFFSAQLAPADKTSLPLAWRKKARWVSAQSDPTRLYGKGVIGLTPWAAHMHLPLDELSLMSQIYAATYYFGDALSRMRGSWNREYLLETLENSHFNRPAASAYISLSLAAGQREAAKGGHLLGFSGPDLKQVTIFGERLTP
jgi:hypothetical protein